MNLAESLKRLGVKWLPARLANGALSLMLLGALVPLMPRMPGASLDESWMTGMNQAMAQGANLGSELVFTYGPYASIHTRTYHPATDALMLWSSAMLAVAFALAFAVLSRGRHWGWHVAFGLLVAGMLPYPADTLLLSYPLIAALAVMRLLGEDEAPATTTKGNYLSCSRQWLLVPLLVPLGLMPLIKGTMLIFCAAVLSFCICVLVVRRRWRVAVLCLVIPVLGVCGFWLASGQGLIHLPRYFVNMVPIASGYTEAMALTGKSSAIWSFLVFSLFFLLVIAGDGARSGLNRGFLTALFAFYFFIVFKGNFVRHDGRVVGAGVALILATIVLAASSKVRWVWALCLMALLAWWNITRHYVSPLDLVTHLLQTTQRQAWSGLRMRLLAPESPRKDFEAVMKTIGDRAGIPRIEGSSDIYSFGQTFLIASGNRWNNRPVLQSYSAYTPGLAEMNRQHLLGADAPSHLFFRLETIDQRYPTLDDGPSWPEILKRYQPARLQGGFLQLDRRRQVAEAAQLVRDPPQMHALGERVPVPMDGGPIYVELDVNPTLLGSLAHTLFKPSRLEIRVELVDGSDRRLRFIAGMGKSPFLISPLVENTEEVALLYGKRSLLAAKEIRAFTIMAVDRRVTMWQSQFQVRFARLEPALEPVEVDNVQVFDRFISDPATTKAVPAVECSGSVDVVNGRTPVPPDLAASGFLQVQGWAAASTSPPALPDAVLVVLTDVFGRRRFVQTRPTPRPDVGAYFKSDALDASGYTANVDLTEIAGPQVLGLALRQADKIYLCPQPVFTVRVGSTHPRAGQ